MPHPSLCAIFLVAVLFLHIAFSRLRPRPISTLFGPPPGSWLVGNLPALVRPVNVGDADFSWTNAFGDAVRIKGTFGRDVLFTTDPKAFQYILNASCYKFPKSPEFRFLTDLFMGQGLIWAEGAQHSRHRKIMDSAFSSAAIKKHLPLFRQTVQQAVSAWKDLVTEGGNPSAEFDVLPWMYRTTLDMLGATAFDYPFGALGDATKNELYQAYDNLFVDAFLQRSDFSLAFEAICGILPKWVLSILLQIRPNKAISQVQNYKRIAQRVAKSLVDRQPHSDINGKDSCHDILSRIVSANLSATTSNKLSNGELLAQLTTLMVAGHETTANTISWALYSLSIHPKVQNELRQEIKAKRVQAVQRGDTELTAADLDSTRLLGAVLKETLRFHPISPQIPRIAGCDDVIPLSTPLRTKTGQFITGIPISKGQGILLSVAAFNRLQSVWGEDADIWRPQRFLEETRITAKTAVGVYANIATFSSGGRNCIGWRYAMLEMQVILAELIENFEFSPPHGNVEILRASTTTMSPMVKGSDSGRTALPLTVTPVA
ncbi:cytochrome P450 [Gautieria morchelliformis]|nr:cytochrome P450 [Gautieria morchelliformis]